MKCLGRTDLEEFTERLVELDTEGRHLGEVHNRQFVRSRGAAHDADKNTGRVESHHARIEMPNAQLRLWSRAELETHRFNLRRMTT